MEQRLNDWQRIECILQWANMTTSYFARQIGLPRAENLYRIKRGLNGISRNLASLIITKYPQINEVWLLTGYGEMLTQAEQTKAAKPLYDVGLEENIRNVSSLESEQPLILPSNIDFDFAMPYLGRAMGELTPPNTVVLLKKIAPEMIIPGDECVIVTKKIVLLRIAKFEESTGQQSRLRLTSTNNQTYGDVFVELDQVEAAYKVKGKILINS